MAQRPRRNHGSAFKARGALEALKEQETLVELGQRFQAQRIGWARPVLESTQEFDKAPVGAIASQERIQAFWILDRVRDVTNTPFFRS